MNDPTQAVGFFGKYITEGEVVLVCAALLGAICHFLNKRWRGEIDGSLWHYMVVTPGLTCATILAILAACLVVVAVGQIEAMRPHMIVALGFGIGWTLDSGIAQRFLGNKDGPDEGGGHSP